MRLNMAYKRIVTVMVLGIGLVVLAGCEKNKKISVGIVTTYINQDIQPEQ